MLKEIEQLRKILRLAKESKKQLKAKIPKFKKQLKAAIHEAQTQSQQNPTNPELKQKLANAETAYNNSITHLFDRAGEIITAVISSLGAGAALSGGLSYLGSSGSIEEKVEQTAWKQQGKLLHSTLNDVTQFIEEISKPLPDNFLNIARDAIIQVTEEMPVKRHQKDAIINLVNSILEIWKKNPPYQEQDIEQPQQKHLTIPHPNQAQMKGKKNAKIAVNSQLGGLIKQAPLNTALYLNMLGLPPNTSIADAIKEAKKKKGSNSFITGRISKTYHFGYYWYDKIEKQLQYIEHFTPSLIVFLNTYYSGINWHNIKDFNKRSIDVLTQLAPLQLPSENKKALAATVNSLKNITDLLMTQSRSTIIVGLYKYTSNIKSQKDKKATIEQKQEAIREAKDLENTPLIKEIIKFSKLSNQLSKNITLSGDDQNKNIIFLWALNNVLQTLIRGKHIFKDSENKDVRDLNDKLALLGPVLQTLSVFGIQPIMQLLSTFGIKYAFIQEQLKAATTPQKPTKKKEKPAALSLPPLQELPTEPLKTEETKTSPADEPIPTVYPVTPPARKNSWDGAAAGVTIGLVLDIMLVTFSVATTILPLLGIVGVLIAAGYLIDRKLAASSNKEATVPPAYQHTEGHKPSVLASSSQPSPLPVAAAVKAPLKEKGLEGETPSRIITKGK